MGEMDLSADEGDRGFAMETVDETRRRRIYTSAEPVCRRVGWSEFQVDAAHDPELVAIFLEEAADIMESTSNLLQDWMDKPSQLDKVAAL